VPTSSFVALSMTMRRNGRARINVDFVDDPDGSVAPDGGRS
jgi:hypothetical protein